MHSSTEKKVPSFYFDKTSTRSQRNKTASKKNDYEVNDVMYNIDNSLLNYGKIHVSIGKVGRNTTSGNRLPGGQLHSGDLSYDVAWSTQDKKTPGFVDIARSLPSKGLNKKVFLRPTGGTIGLCYDDPAMKYISGPSIGKQVSRSQRNRVGFVVSDSQSAEWNRQQQGLNVKYCLTDKRRAGKLATFTKLVPKISNPALEKQSDLSFANSECTSQIDVSYYATKRPIARSIRLGPGLKGR